jgi:roadblock/LC7 domain-containing protein
MVNPYELLTKALADFYITPNKANYEAVRGILARGKLTVFVERNVNRNEDVFVENSTMAISSVLKTMSPELHS